ncbi:MAG: PG0541 family transporter-associated protein [Candidatus Omnitrophota bacterium]|jgi:nitrogen regulatory protein PII
MKMIMVVYNEAVDDEIMEALESSSLENYTKIKSIYGRGKTSGAHLGNDIWPGRNNMIFVSCQDKESAVFVSAIGKLRKTLGKEGVKAFVMPLDEII